MNKKFLSLVLALVMVLGTFGSVFAETKAPEAKDAKKSEVKVPEKKDSNEKVQWLVDNEIVVGRKVNKDDKNADLALDKDIQRAEVTKLLIYAIGQQDLAARLNGVYAPYSDVPANHWANGLIAAGSTVASPANALPFLHGIGHNMFQPERQVRYDELAKMLVVLVKKDLTKDGLAAAKWPTDWMNWAAQLGIFDGINTPVDGSKPAVRQDAFVMLYNALYKIGELRNLPAGETMGIISDATANKIVLNQGDKEKKFTVSANTNFVPGGKYEGRADKESVLWNTLVNEDRTYYIGSLVRVIADDKGNVSHIVQLGNPENLAIPSKGWVGVAEKQLPANKIALANLADHDKILIGKTEIRTNDDTRYFVADYHENQLTEVKDKAAALALFDKGTIEANKVYVGYDVLENSKINEAKVVVFNDVDKDNTRSDLVRVVTPFNNKYQVTAQKAGYQPTEKIVYDLKDYKGGFPLNTEFEKNDVIKLYDKHADVLIDSSEAPVYEIKEVKYEKINGVEKVNGRIVGVTLSDGKGEAELDILRDADLFFGNGIKKGAHVQVRFEGENAVLTDRNHANNTKALNIVSVVDKALDGYLPTDIRTDNREVTGVLMAAPVKDKDTWRITLKVKGYSETYTISYDLKGKLDQLAGQEITVVAEQTKYLDNAKGYVVEVLGATELGKAQEPAYTEIDGLNNLDAAEKANLKEKVLNAADKDEVAKIVKEAKAKNAEKVLAKAKADVEKAVKANSGKLKVATLDKAGVEGAVTPAVSNQAVTVKATVTGTKAKIELTTQDAAEPVVLENVEIAL